MADRLTEDVLYELLETGTEDGTHVPALDASPRRGDPEYAAADLYETQRAARVTVAELAGALIAARAEVCRLRHVLADIGERAAREGDRG